MKFLLPTLLVAVSLGAGCATTKQETSFKPVPAASNVDSSLGNLATVTGAKIYEGREQGEKTAQAKPLKPSKQTSAEKQIVTPETGVTGKVIVYNTAGRFVVAGFPIGRMPGIGTRLFAYRNDLKVGEIKITGPQRDDNIVADLVTGEAQAGDELRDK